MRRPREAKVMDDMNFLEFVAIFGGHLFDDPDENSFLLYYIELCEERAYKIKKKRFSCPTM